jgi:DNA end-binding protein Ku
MFRKRMKDAELKLAQQLIDQSSDRLVPAPIPTRWRRIEAAVQKKVEGQEITMSEAPEAARKSSTLKHCARAREEGARSRSRSGTASRRNTQTRQASPTGRSTPRKAAKK